MGRIGRQSTNPSREHDAFHGNCGNHLPCIRYVLEPLALCLGARPDRHHKGSVVGDRDFHAGDVHHQPVERNPTLGAGDPVVRAGDDAGRLASALSLAA
jgi:hypothetical protein